MFEQIAEHFSLALTILSTFGLWIGLISLGRKTKGKTWVCMIVGGVLYSASIFLKIWWEIERSRAPGSWLNMDYEIRMHLVSISAGITFTWTYGLIIFFIGFALYNARSARLEQRISELEMMNLAQATELERLRNR